MIPYKTLPTSRVVAQTPEFIEAVVMPWVREVTAHHQRFRVPAYRAHRIGNVINIEGTRWMVPDAEPEILYHVATDPDGQDLAKDGSGRNIQCWIPSPVPLPKALEDLAVVHPKFKAVR